MAKRTKLTAPSAEDLAKLDADFRSENTVRPNPATAPIAAVAADTAQKTDLEPAQQKLNRLDAERLRDAEEQGRLIEDIPIDKINELVMVRDRSVIDAAELKELQLSLIANGLRLPIEVYKTEDGYGLISGYRRLLATRELNASYPTEYKTIKALIRPEQEKPKAIQAMVEENEIRANLSHYERGRIAAIAADQGAFTSTDAAIDGLFAAASPAKRSKVRSFAEIFNELGDLLKFPEDLSERRGLKLSTALRAGGVDRLRAVLEAGGFASPQEEWEALEPVIMAFNDKPTSTPKRGRPKMPPAVGWNGDVLTLASGISLRKEHDGQSYLVRITGKGITGELLDSLMVEMQYLLDKPGKKR